MEFTKDVAIASQRLFELITKDKNLHKVLNMGEELLSTPISFFDSLSGTLSYSKGYTVDDPSNTNWIQYNSSLLQSNSDFLSNIENIEDETPFIVKLNSDLSILVSKVYYCGNYVGYINITNLYTPLESLNIEIIKQIGYCAAIVILLKDNIPEVEEIFSDENIIFDQILSKKYKTITDFNFLSKNYSFKRYKEFHIICININSDNLKQIRKDIILKAQEYELGLWTKIHNNMIVAMIGINQKNTNANYFLGDIQNTYEKKDIIIGVSDPFIQILSTHEHLKKVESIMMDSKNSNNSKRIHFYDDYKFKIFLKDVNEFIQGATNYISYKIIQILNYDLNNKTEYGITLSTYLSSSMSPQLASEKLFIHKNTVIYRINKIKELFDVDFTNAEQCFQLYFSFQLLLVRGWESKY